MRSIPLHPSIVPYLLLPLALCLGLFFDSMGFRVFALTGLLVVVYGIMLVPIKWALFFVFVYIGLEGFLKVVSNYHPVVHVGSDLIVIALCTKVLWSNFINERTNFPMPPLAILFAVHFLWVFVTLFNPYSLGFIPSIAGSKVYVSMWLLFFFGYYLADDEKDIRFFMIPFLITVALHTVFGLYQGMVGPESVISLHPRYAVQLEKYGEYAFRPFGLTNQPGAPSVQIYQTLPFMLYFLFHYRSWLMRLSLMLYLPFATTLLVLCQVRSAIVKGIVGTALFLIGSIHVASRVSAKVTQGLLATTTVMVLLMVYFLPSMLEMTVDSYDRNVEAIDRSLSIFDYETFVDARQGAWHRFTVYVQDVPFGAGFSRIGAAAGAFKHYEDPYFTHKYFFADNLWVAALVEIGLPGMLIFTFILIGVFYRAITGYFKIKNIQLQVLHLAILSSIISIFIGSYGGEGILYNPEASFFWFFSGILMKIPELDRLKNSEELNGLKVFN